VSGKNVAAWWFGRQDSWRLRISERRSIAFAIGQPTGEKAIRNAAHHAEPSDACRRGGYQVADGLKAGSDWFGQRPADQGYPTRVNKRA
jgi:hypothetical protein